MNQWLTDRSASPDSFFRVTIQWLKIQPVSVMKNPTSADIMEQSVCFHMYMKVCRTLNILDTRCFTYVTLFSQQQLIKIPVCSIPDMEACCCHHCMSETVWTSEFLNASDNTVHHWTWPSDSWIIKSVPITTRGNCVHIHYFFYYFLEGADLTALRNNWK